MEILRSLGSFPDSSIEPHGVLWIWFKPNACDQCACCFSSHRWKTPPPKMPNICGVQLLFTCWLNQSYWLVIISDVVLLRLNNLCVACYFCFYPWISFHHIEIKLGKGTHISLVTWPSAQRMRFCNSSHCPSWSAPWLCSRRGSSTRPLAVFHPGKPMGWRPLLTQECRRKKVEIAWKWCSRLREILRYCIPPFLGVTDGHCIIKFYALPCSMCPLVCRFKPQITREAMVLLVLFLSTGREHVGKCGLARFVAVSIV